MEFTEEHKKQVEKMIVDTTIDALGAGVIQEPDLKLIADFVLARIDVIKNQDELITFLTELADKWKFFLPIERFSIAEAQHTEEQKSIHTAEGLVKTGQIDQALDVLKAANGGGI